MANNNLPDGFYEDTERELGWDDEIQNDGQDFELVPEGDYDFEVIAFERARHPGSEKLPACNKAVIHIKVTGGDGATTTIFHNLFLHSRTEGMISSFLVGIGQKKKGESIKPRWSEVVGTRGRCKVGFRKYKPEGSNEERTYNEIKRFYEPAERTPAQQATFQAGTF